MFGGEIQHIEFKYYGSSIEAVLDKLPMAEIAEESEGCYTVKAETLERHFDVDSKSREQG